jgi:2-C-methyl-D-erythritol 4-phosphate cytidylyltransferase
VTVNSSEQPGRGEVVVGVVLVAAGSGRRLGHGIPKARVLCGGRTLLEHALDSVLGSGIARYVVVVLPADDAVLTAVVHTAARSTHAGATLVTATSGGTTRTASVNAGLEALSASVGTVLVHDAARALTPPGVFRRVAAAVAAGASAVIPVLPVVDTVKVVESGLVTGTPDRALLRAVQTPQGFDVAALRAAHSSPAASHAGITDDAMLMEALGIVVHAVEGDPLAFKVTTPFDLTVAEAVLAQRAASADPSSTTPISRSSRVHE